MSLRDPYQFMNDVYQNCIVTEDKKNSLGYQNNLMFGSQGALANFHFKQSIKPMTKDSYVVFSEAFGFQQVDAKNEEEAYEKAAELAARNRAKVLVLKPIGSEEPEYKTVRKTF